MADGTEGAQGSYDHFHPSLTLKTLEFRLDEQKPSGLVDAQAAPKSETHLNLQTLTHAHTQTRSASAGLEKLKLTAEKRKAS